VVALFRLPLASEFSMGCNITLKLATYIPLPLSVSAAVYFFWRAFQGLPGSDGQGRDFLAGGMYSLIPAIALTLFRPRVSLSCS
jgi:hypothetical protein